MSDPAKIVDELLLSYHEDPRAQRIGKLYLPDREEIIEVVKLALQLFYPGFFGKLVLRDDDLRVHVAGVVAEFQERLQRQVECCLCHAEQETLQHLAPDVPRCRNAGYELASRVVASLPTLRARLVLDAQAAYDGDPAASNLDEVILAYPGLLAISVHRLAHELYRLGVPLMPRIMSEWAHQRTGCDIHPGATIGDSFFIDHATGVVVGETSRIGDRVKLYQGVTLGALSIRKDERGRVIRGTKRHPTVESDVTVYANATVLGGDTVVGSGAVIGGSVFVTKSLSAGNRVMLEPPAMKIATGPIDFEI